MSWVDEMCHGSRYEYGLMTERLYPTFFVLDITDMNETLRLCVDNFFRQ
jgi:hypothetical protein